MINSISTHSISPLKVLRGDNAWDEGKKLIPSICFKPLFIGRSQKTLSIRRYLMKTLSDIGITPIVGELKYDCCEYDLKILEELALDNKCDGVIASGGGKVLDAGKLIAHRIGVPCITIPLSASTCAGWTALSNIYSPNGAFERDEELESCPRLLIFDHNFVRQAPNRTLASGIADALAKWYEASVSSGSSKDGLVQQAVQMARVLRDQLLIDASKALEDPNSAAWVRVSEGCALSAGLIGGVGGECCRTVAAHAVHNGLTQINSSKKSLHGEKVGYGILVQLRLEEVISGNQLSAQSRKQLLSFLKKLSLPTNLEDLGLADISVSELHRACTFACENSSDISHLPFKVTSMQMLEALIGAGEEEQLSESSVIGQKNNLGE